MVFQFGAAFCPAVVPDISVNVHNGDADVFVFQAVYVVPENSGIRLEKVVDVIVAVLQPRVQALDPIILLPLVLEVDEAQCE